jgi:LmbE family N-acetylglucosaminyl deacetylase
VRCTLFCATDGDAGKAFGQRPANRAELGRARRHELAQAATLLGIAAVDMRGHPDGALATMDQDALVGEVVAHLRRERPDVVITFGPEGAPNTHVDHRAISRACTAAFFLAGNPRAYAEQVAGLPPHRPKRLFYVTWPDPAPDAELQVRGVPFTARVDVRAFIDRERAAFRAHASQSHLEDRFNELAATNEELFAFVSGVAQPDTEITDLFAGL